MRPVRQTEQLIRSVILLATSALLSVIAYFAGVFRLPDQNWTYGFILAIVASAALVSRVGAKWVMRRLAERQARG
jgi:uncharacterized membrane protein YfcA